MWQTLIFTILKPVARRILKATLSGLDDRIDTGQEREALMEELLDKYRPQIIKTGAQMLEKGHIVLESKGY